MNTKHLILLSVFCILTSVLHAEDVTPAVLYEWSFNEASDLDGWRNGGNIKDLTIENGVLKGTYTGRDPILFLPKVEFATKPGLVVEITMKVDFATQGEFYFTNTHEGPFGGFSGEKVKTWKIPGDGNFHTTRLLPGWLNEGNIIQLRLDPGSCHNVENWGKTGFEIDSVRILDLNYDQLPCREGTWNFHNENYLENGWELVTEEGKSPQLVIGPIRLKNGEFLSWCAVEMSTNAGFAGRIMLWNDKMKESIEVPFQLQPDGKMHHYNILTYAENFSPAEPFYMALEMTDVPEAITAVKSITFATEPQGEAYLEIRDGGGIADVLPRAGHPIAVEFQMTNPGGKVAKNVKLDKVSLPEGVTILDVTFPTVSLEAFDSVICKMKIQSEKAITGTAKVNFVFESGDKKEKCTKIYEFPVEILPSLNLPNANYVPEPKPAKTEYEIGALYFPGWGTPDAWERIFPIAPIRKPVLGWYDETNPEVIDWQIKWAVENGIQYFLVDWYWNRGSQHLDHWIKGFQKAKYRSYFKWAMMWANHNGPGSHSEEDQMAVTKFWIENYFNTPEYYQIDGKPVVMIWSPSGMDNDLRKIYRQKGVELLPGEGVKKLLDLSRKMVIEAGFKGIYFIAMKWPEASTDAKDIQWLADAGFDMTSLYHYMDDGGKAPNKRYFSFDYCVNSIRPYWEARQKTGILPFLPNLSTGWDSRPWHGMKQTVIYDRTPEKFQKICEECKEFSDKNGIRNIILAPLNEWGEGSYAEPNKEFGFSMYEAVRNTFCERPAEDWSVNHTPADVGLGPYDFVFRTHDIKIARHSEFLASETLSNGGKVSNHHLVWGSLMGVSIPECLDGFLTFRTQSRDPAIQAKFPNLQSSHCPRIAIRMRITPEKGEQLWKNDHVQLFWGSHILPITESTSMRLPVFIDGEFHDYVFEVGKSPAWLGKIGTLRLDPCNQPKMKIDIDWIHLEK